MDPGVVISWIDQYKADPKARKKHIASYLEGRLTDYLSQFPDDEQKIVEKYLAYFNLPKTTEETKPPARVLTPQEVGYLNPNVPRPREEGAPPRTETKDIIDIETGDVWGKYVEKEVAGFQPGTRLKIKEGTTTGFHDDMTLLGFFADLQTEAVDESMAVVKVGDRYEKISVSNLRASYERFESPPPPEPGELLPFNYESAEARKYGFSEISIEAHPKAQALVSAIYARDSAYVTLHKAGDPDPDSTSTPPDILTADKYKLNETAIKAYWLANCANLPDTPEKSLWYFQALADHRLSNTIDLDSAATINNPSKPHHPAFGQKEFLLAMDFEEFDYNNAIDKQSAITPQTKKILQALFGKDDPTSITRDEVNTALWSNHEARIQSNKARTIIKELLPAGENPDNYELRLLRPDEYQRASQSLGFGQKNLWTHMDGYYVHDDGNRSFLIGGHRDYGGAAYVDRSFRDARGGGIGVRLVLSRKS